MSEIRLQESYAAPPEAIWGQLTQPELLSTWCMPTSDFRLEKGASFTFQSEPNRFWDGIFVCRVEDFTDGSYLRYRCKSRSMNLDSIVEWTIEESDDTSIVKLKHSGFSGIKGQFYRILLTGGWK